MSMHIIWAGDDGAKLWKNASFFQKDEPNIIVTNQHINATEKSKMSQNIAVSDFLKIILDFF